MASNAALVFSVLCAALAPEAGTASRVRRTAPSWNQIIQDIDVAEKDSPESASDVARPHPVASIPATAVSRVPRSSAPVTAPVAVAHAATDSVKWQWQWHTPTHQLVAVIVLGEKAVKVNTSEMQHFQVQDKYQSQEQSLDNGPLSPPCNKEVKKLKSDPERSARAQACEEAESTETMMKMLESADLKGATNMVSTTFHICGNISSSCSNEYAPNLVQMVRLSGMAVTEKCKKAAEANLPTAGQTPSSTCQRILMQELLQNLQGRDVDGAIARAEAGLHVCVGIEKPCDFQFAPVLVTQISEALQAQQMQQEEQQIAQVLLRGLSNTEKFADETGLLKSNGEKMRDSMSLLSVAKSLRMTSGRPMAALL